MDIDEYIRILLRRWPVWLGVMILLGLAGYIYASGLPTTYTGYSSVSFVKKMVSTTDQAAAYQYDNFYSLESSRLLTQIASGWVADPGVVAEIYQAASVTIPDGIPVARYSQLVTAQALPGATMQISTQATTAEEAEALAVEAQTLIVGRITQLESTGALADVQVLTTDPLTSPRAASATLYAAAGLLAGALMGFVLTFIIESMRKHR